MHSLKQRLVAFFNPLTARTRWDNRANLPAIAHTLTVDMVHEIFRAAEGGQPDRLFALYRDMILAHSHLQGRAADRKRAVLGDQINLQPFDKLSALDKQTVDATWPLTRHSDWMSACNHLLDASLYPVSVVEKVFKRSRKPGLSYELDRLIPVPYELLDFTTGKLRIRDTDAEGRPLSTTFEADPARYIIHRGHLLTTADHWGGPLRSLVVWYLLGMMGREWWARFLDRYGSPFMVGKYLDGDESSASVLRQAMAWATRVGGLTITADTEVELVQATASDSGTAFQTFHDVSNREISKLILGQTLSSDAQATGMGSGVATSQEGVRQDIRQFDALLLGNTMRVQLCAQYLRINQIAGEPPTFVWGSISPLEMKSWADVLTSLKTAGLRLTDDGIIQTAERLGLSLERDNSPAPANPFMPFGVQPFAAPDVVASIEKQSRTAAATLAQTLGKHHAPIVQIIRESTSPDDCLAKVEAYTANLQPGERARIMEEVLITYTANGAAAHSA